MCCCWVDSFNSAYSKAEQIFWDFFFFLIYRTDFSIGWKAEHCCWHLVRREDHIKDILPIFLPRGCFGQLTFGIWGAWRNHLWLLNFKKKKESQTIAYFWARVEIRTRKIISSLTLWAKLSLTKIFEVPRCDLCRLYCSITETMLGIYQL